MNILETHIELDFRIDDIDSSRYDHILPAYKDMVINDMTDKFIEKEWKKYENTKDLNELVRTLGSIVEQDLKRPALLESKDKQFINLPANLRYFLESRSLVATKCAKTEEIETKEYIAVLAFGKKDVYDTYSIFTDGNVIFSTGDIPDYVPVIGAESFLLRDYILNNHASSVEIYWERYNNIYKSNNFIIVSKTRFIVVTDTLSTAGVTETKYKQVSADDVKETPNRPFVGDMGELYHYISRPFSEPSRRSPVTSRSKNILYVFTKNFYVKDVIISYVRKPRPVNYALNQSSELPEDSLLEVIDMATQFIKAILADPNFQTIALENKILNS